MFRSPLTLARSSPSSGGGRGAGKSTLLRIAAGLERPDSGRVRVGGQSLDRLSENELTTLRRTEVSCVWTGNTPFGDASVAELVALPLRVQNHDSRTARMYARRALETFDIAYCADAAFDEVSDGERRLASIAQALITKPRLLLMDQPASDLGLSDTTNLLDILRTLASEAGIGILMTAHNAAEAAAADTRRFRHRPGCRGARRRTHPHRRACGDRCRGDDGDAQHRRRSAGP